MVFRETELQGAFIVDVEPLSDERGFFARGWCAQEFEHKGLAARVVQSNISFNKNMGTLRGLHYQLPPHAETKLVRCTQGAIYDVIVDLRPASPTFTNWIGVELTSKNHRMLYVPEGFAHGLQTLEDNTEVFYQVSAFYVPNAERGARYNDLAFGIHWPLEVSAISEKDASWPDYVAGSI